MLVGGVHLCRVSASGATVEVVDVGGSDFHAIVAQNRFDADCDPDATNLPDRILLGCDLGLIRLRDYACSTSAHEELNHGLRTTQFHSAAAIADPDASNLVGTLQDHSALLEVDGEWKKVGLGQGDGGMTSAGGRIPGFSVIV